MKHKAWEEKGKGFYRLLLPFMGCVCRRTSLSEGWGAGRGGGMEGGRAVRGRGVQGHGGEEGRATGCIISVLPERRAVRKVCWQGGFQGKSTQSFYKLSERHLAIQ